MKTVNVDLEDILSLVRMQLGVRNVKPEDRLMEDLGAESSDIVNIIAAAEDKYGISLDEADIPGIRSIRELFELIRSYR